jgi:hypothetical protein
MSSDGTLSGSSCGKVRSLKLHSGGVHVEGACPKEAKAHPRHSALGVVVARARSAASWLFALATSIHVFQWFLLTLATRSRENLGT